MAAVPPQEGKESPQEAFAFLDAHLPPEARRFHDFAAAEDEAGEVIPQWARDWQATLFDHGWMVPAYPPELGGRNATPVQTLVYLEEMASRGALGALQIVGAALVISGVLLVSMKRS